MSTATLTPKEPIVVLRPVGKLAADYSPACGKPYIELRSDTYSLTLWRHYQPDPKHLHAPHPAIWRGMETRRGSDGRRWDSLSGDFVCDDFGYLVPVGGAA